MSLAEFQSGFWHALWTPATEPAHHTLGTAGAFAPASHPGFAVYRNTVLKGCADALISLYPAVHRLCGDDWMRAVALDFARASPPAGGDLQHYGDAFAEFVDRALSGGDLAWMGEVARLDRLWNESHVAADAPVLDLGTLARLAPERLTVLRLLPHPAARWHQSGTWPTFSLWQAARTAAADPNPSHWSPQAALMTRPHGAVLACEISLAACALLDACAAGTALGEALDAVQTGHPDADVGSELALLLQQGAFARPPACLTESSP